MNNTAEIAWCEWYSVVSLSVSGIFSNRVIKYLAHLRSAFGQFVDILESNVKVQS